MNSRSCWFASLVALGLALAVQPAAARAPAWLREVAARPVPAQKEDVEAVQLLSDVELEVRADGRLRKRVRAAFRILRSAAAARAVAYVVYDSRSRVKDMSAWAILPDGRNLDRDFSSAIDAALADVQGSEMISDIRTKMLQPPEAGVGAVVGYEYEVESTPLALADYFDFQSTVPVLEARYSLRLPRGWAIQANWVNHAPVEPVKEDERNWQWTLRDQAAIKVEDRMPSLPSVAARLQVAFARAGSEPQLGTWQGIGSWYAELAKDRFTPTDAIRAKVAELTRDKPAGVEQLRALAAFVQAEIRYVAIALGIGGFQPHAAAEVFTNRYGDCKDKATLLATMLREVGIDSLPVLVNTDRALVDPQTPPGLMFNHVILAVLLPREQLTPDMLAVADAGDGRALVFFDPTDEIAPVGRIAGARQGAWGLIAVKEGSRLVQLPRMGFRDSGVQRKAQLQLDAQGALRGSFTELLTGDQASFERHVLRTATRQADQVKPVEARLAASLTAFRMTSAEPGNRTALALPLEWRYSVEASAYARRSGELLMVRPRVLGIKGENVADMEERVHDLMFPEARQDQDEISIELPAGFAVDSLPDPVDIDVGFAAYRSRTEVNGTQLRYTRTMELRELRIPAAKAADLRRLNLAIARDERAVVILKVAPK